MKTDCIYHFITVIIFVFLSGTAMSAQENVPKGYELVDSVIYRPAAVADSTLVGKNVISLMTSARADKAAVNVKQSAEVASSLENHIAGNAERNLSGYRVRIFFDNRQSARNESEEVLKRFETLYHDVSAYRSYANPYFKVTVGDFRTKTEAMALLERIKTEFPSAFVIKENITFPVVDKNNAFVTDTVKVMRPVQSSL